MNVTKYKATLCRSIFSATLIVLTIAVIAKYINASDLLSAKDRRISVSADNRFDTNSDIYGKHVAVATNADVNNVKPVVMWYSRQWGWGRYEPLENITGSGFFSHVMLVGLHRNYVPNYIDNPRFKKAVKICRDNGVEVIWTRFLFPNHKIKGFTLETAFNPGYYIDQIQNIKREAAQAGIKLVAFDTEPCCKSPLVPYKSKPFSKEDYEKISTAIKVAIGYAGPVDYVLPSAAAEENHLYNAAAQIGKYIIAEYTYYDLPVVHRNNPDKNRPYDIFGAYVGVTKENKHNPNLNLYTPKEILERKELWSHKKGLFIYSGNAAPEVSREFWKLKEDKPKN